MDSRRSDVEGYLTVGFYEDGTVREIFITTAKAGSTISGLIECFAMAVPLAVQYGVSRKVLGDKSSAIDAFRGALPDCLIRPSPT
jgi:ribonucleoside-diphosphate reductase alpha chain